ncbi:hypothetical protein [Tunturiibacter gelidiferens]|uniref:hypothetical protein n=1 Tax=Tunturiibacter gelidiferens TaxID=3069689 RepID=UPI003D9BA339
MIGTLLVAIPLLILAAIPLFCVLLGSLGMDIHWNGSKVHFYVAMLCVVLTLFACFFTGFRLRRKGGRDAS